MGKMYDAWTGQDPVAEPITVEEALDLMTEAYENSPTGLEELLSDLGAVFGDFPDPDAVALYQSQKDYKT